MSEPAVDVLSAGELSSFEHLAFGAHRTGLSFDVGRGRALAVGARLDGAPVGLALASLCAEHASLRSVTVDPLRRRQGIARSLLPAMQAALRRAGAARVEAIFTGGHESAPAIRGLLRAAGWAEPQPHMLQCRAGVSALQAPVLRDARPPGPEFEIFRWTALTTAERRSLFASQRASPWIPPDLEPWRHEGNCFPLNSLGLRYRGEVVGWCLTHVIGPRVCQYTCSFVRSDLGRRSHILPLYAAATRMQQEAMGEAAEAVWAVPIHHAAMAAFVRRRLGPWLSRLDVIERSTLDLG